MIFYDEQGNKYESIVRVSDNSEIYIRPVKKTEKKVSCGLYLHRDGMDTPELLGASLQLTPTTANKLSEAISALVEGVQDSKMQDFPSGLANKFIAARKAYREGQ